MAKVTLTRSGKAEQRINAWILLQMKVQKKSQNDIGYVINLPGKCIGDRLKGATPWKFGELFEVVDYLEGRLEDIL